MKISVLLLEAVLGDLYIHNLRGSNNRLNEATKQRANNNRLFDSQNNNNGGYNAADAGVEAAKIESEQHQEYFIQSGKKGKSYINIEWTNQHGCGRRDNEDTNAIDCHLVIQYKCDDTDESDQKVRNGLSTESPAYTSNTNGGSETHAQLTSRRKGDLASNDENVTGRHERWENYDSCATRQRNENLFVADQNLAGNSAIYTRQNANGQRSAYECPEERDYFPYWHPTEWTDIAVLTNNIGNCKFYEKESSNRKAKGECVEHYPLASGCSSSKLEKHKLSNQICLPIRKPTSTANTRDKCEKNKGSWYEFYDYLDTFIGYNEDNCKKNAKIYGFSSDDVTFGYPRQIGSERHNEPFQTCIVLHPRIDCKLAPWTRANHLGNTDKTNEQPSYRWQLPYFPQEKEKECVFRMRYNISSDDYLEKFDATDITPFFSYQYLENDPIVQLATGVNLQLAINTAQIARTFEDRSHTFRLIPRGLVDITDSEQIENLNVRGKRGNIVQVYPAVEYDFSPVRSDLKSGNLLHVQWSGSNTNPKENDGEGTAQTDRNNLVLVGEPNWNIPNLPINGPYLGRPEPLDKIAENMEWKWTWSSDQSVMNDKTNLGIQLASSGYYECLSGCSKSVANLSPLQGQLNNAAASYHGNIVRVTTKSTKTIHFLCTRNNNFSNRAQKGEIIIRPKKPIFYFDDEIFHDLELHTGKIDPTKPTKPIKYEIFHDKEVDFAKPNPTKIYPIRKPNRTFKPANKPEPFKPRPFQRFF